MDSFILSFQFRVSALALKWIGESQEFSQPIGGASDLYDKGYSQYRVSNFLFRGLLSGRHLQGMQFSKIQKGGMRRWVKLPML